MPTAFLKSHSHYKNMQINTVKVKLLFLLPAVLFFSAEWHRNLSEAQIIAQKEHKYILLNFSGSDWCGPCIRLKKEFFESDVFKNMADTQLVLVNADFPRNRKNQPAPEQQKINDEIADKYNPQGKFPFTLLLNEKGSVMNSWEGLPNKSPEIFVEEIRNVIYRTSNGR
jgi:thioredoxin-related protein